MIQSVNPATGLAMRSYDAYSRPEVDEIIGRVRSAQMHWASISFEARSEHMRTAAVLLRRRLGELSRLMVLEMGKPVVQAEAEVEKCAWVCDFYAEHAEEFLSPEPVETEEAVTSYVCFRPLGIILAVMPWNFPLWQVFRFAAPTLMAGNGALLKHASNVPGCALAIERVFADAGFSADLFRTLLIPAADVEHVVKHPAVRAVSLTGSTPAGRAVARAAGEVLKKTVLELGGSDPYVVLEDADLPEAVRICVQSRLINNGQSCIAAKRFVVPRSIRGTFESLFVDTTRAYRVGDPLDRTTDIGPLARTDLRDELHAQVVRSIELGADCLLGGTIPDRDGAYYPPTVLTDVAPGMPAYEEELFGPVASIIPVENEAEAIRVANDSAFGLGAAVLTRNLVRGRKIAEEQLEAGACFVNAFVRSDPRLPFGGIKESGYGRELGRQGIHEFVNIKTVYVSE